MDFEKPPQVVTGSPEQLPESLSVEELEAALRSLKEKDKTYWEEITEAERKIAELNLLIQEKVKAGVANSRRETTLAFEWTKKKFGGDGKSFSPDQLEAMLRQSPQDDNGAGI